MSSFITLLRSFNHATKSMASSPSISYFIKNSPAMSYSRRLYITESTMSYPRKLYTTENTITPTSATPESCSRVLYFLKDEESLDQLNDCDTSLESRKLKKKIKQENKKKLFIKQNII